MIALDACMDDWTVTVDGSMSVAGFFIGVLKLMTVDSELHPGQSKIKGTSMLDNPWFPKDYCWIAMTINKLELRYR